MVAERRVARTRKILHLDMDCYYAAIEMRDHPEWRGKALAVGGRPEHRGVVATASYEARKFGIHSAMSSAYAVKLCPDLLLVPPRFDVYKIESQKIFSIYREYSDLVEPLSLDEAYIDVSNSHFFGGSGTLIARDIRSRVFEATSLTVSAGVAPNKFLAKVASDWKKPNGLTVVTNEMIDAFVKELPVKKIPGVGKVTARKLELMGIKKCADLQAWSLGECKRHFGAWGLELYYLSRGIDERPVTVSRERKSLGVEDTFAKDVFEAQGLKGPLKAVYDELVQRRKRKAEEIAVDGLTLKIKTSSFQSLTRAILRREPQSFDEVWAVALPHLEKFAPKGVRLVGLTLSVAGENGHQLEFDLNSECVAGD